jgi:single-strand DNA-binding protein
MAVNQVTLLGTLGRDPEIKSVQSGDKVCNFSVATSEKWKDKSSGEQKEATDWHQIVIWGRLVEVAEKHLRKGSKVYLQGTLKTRKYTDKKGDERSVTEVVLRGYDSKLEILTWADSNGGGSREQSKPARSSNTEGYLDDEIPF